MPKNPFVWRSLHLALLGVKDEQIRDLREQLADARLDRLRTETARDVAIKQAFEAMTPKPVEIPAPIQRRRRDTPETPKPPKTLDLAEVDPSDRDAIVALALNEMPAGKQSGSMLLQKMESIRAQVVMARAVKSSRSKEVGVMSVPEVIQQRIEAAEALGRENARVQ